jgi:chromosome segregation ATPase
VTKKKDLEQQIVALSTTVKADYDKLIAEKLLISQEKEGLIKRQRETQDQITNLKKDKEQLKAQYEDLNGQLQEEQKKKDVSQEIQNATGKKLKDQTEKISQLDRKREDLERTIKEY